MGLPHQCLDPAIKPIDRAMRIAGPAFTIAAAADPRSDKEYDDFPEVSTFDFFKRMYPGCVVLVAAAGDSRAGHWGELMSTAAKARGAAGVIVDGGTRDGNLLFDIPDWPVFARRPNRRRAPVSAPSKSRLPSAAVSPLRRRFDTARIALDCFG